LALRCHLELSKDEVLHVHARDLHLGELELDELKLADRSSELHACEDVLGA
jgi:hypothetical protein